MSSLLESSFNSQSKDNHFTFSSSKEHDVISVAPPDDDCSQELIFKDLMFQSPNRCFRCNCKKVFKSLGSIFVGLKREYCSEEKGIDGISLDPEPVSKKIKKSSCDHYIKKVENGKNEVKEVILFPEREERPVFEGVKQVVCNPIKDQTKKIKKKEYKHCKRFDSISKFLLNFFLKEKIDHKLIDKFNPIEKKLVCAYFKRVKKDEVTIDKLKKSKNVKSFLNKNLPKRKQSNNMGKRNEEKLKKIYKEFFRNQKKQYINALRKGDLKNITFFEDLFGDIINNEGFDKFLVLSICLEKLVFEKKSGKTSDLLEITKKSIEVESRKKYTMNKISASFRYLVRKSKRVKKIFFDYLKDKKKNSIFADKRFVITNKINNIVEDWKKMFIYFNKDEDKFFNFIERKYKNPKFKAPWTMGMFEKSVAFCKEDLKDTKLEYEFYNDKELFSKCFQYK